MNMSQCLFLDGFGHAAAELAEMFGAHGQDMICLSPLNHDGGNANNILNCPDPDACYASRIEEARESIQLHTLFNGKPHPFGEGELAAFESAFGR